ncbi:MAG: 30S ribosomal protein S2 [Planctomycetota bacterium]|nr:30S ribosomal protein S2 [Planctomycetota bacterium]
MAIVNAKDLLATGAHFGHRTSRWNPKMEPYILGKRNKIHIINLRETVRGIVAAYFFCRKVAAEGKQVLFVGTKRQAREVITMHALRCEMPYCAERWLGGSLTNLATIRLRVKRLLELEQMDATGEINTYNKKMQSALNREKRKIKRNLDGIRNMHELPGTVFVIDPTMERNAVLEARRLSIPVIGMLDTDADPTDIDLPIPANDDAIRAIDLVVAKLADGCLEGMNMRKTHPELAVKAQERAFAHQVTQQETPPTGAALIGG